VVNGRKKKSSFSFHFIFPLTNFTQTFIFSFDLKLLFYHGSRPLLMHFFPFPCPINYDRVFWCHTSFPHSLPIWFWLKIYFPFLEIMVLHMATFYKPQTAQVNEECISKSSLDLMLTQHPRDEDPNLWKVCARLEVNPPRTWYYHIFLNSHTLVILLQIDLTYGDEPETIWEGYYETENTSIFTWSSILSVGHYRWLRSWIRHLPPNSKTNYPGHTIQRILDCL